MEHLVNSEAHGLNYTTSIEVRPDHSRATDGSLRRLERAEGYHNRRYLCEARGREIGPDQYFSLRRLEQDAGYHNRRSGRPDAFPTKDSFNVLLRILIRKLPLNQLEVFS